MQIQGSWTRSFLVERNIDRVQLLAGSVSLEASGERRV
jgi:hypothetical protein